MEEGEREGWKRKGLRTTAAATAPATGLTVTYIRREIDREIGGDDVLSIHDEIKTPTTHALSDVADFLSHRSKRK